MCAGGGRRHRDLVALHRGVGPGHAAAREHRDADIRRRHVTRNANIMTLRVDGSDRNHSNPQGEVFLDPFRRAPGGLGPYLRPGLRSLRSHRRAQTGSRGLSAHWRPKRSRRRLPCSPPCSGFRGSPWSIAARRRRRPSSHRQRLEAGFVCHLGEIAKDREAFVKIAGRGR